MSIEVKKLLNVWTPVSHLLFVPQTENEYNRIVTYLDELIDEVGEDEGHPLASLMDILGVLIEKYEDEYIPEITAL